MYTEQQLRNTEFRAFLYGAIFSAIAIFMAIVVFLVLFAILGLKSDIFGALYITDENVYLILTKIRMIGNDLIKWQH